MRAGDGAVTCFPFIIVDGEPVGFLRDVSCAGGRMTSQTTFFKIPLQVDYITANTDAGDLVDTYTDITRRRRNRNRASLRT